MRILLLLTTCILSMSTFANDYIIFSVDHKLPMKNGDKTQKNYFVNIGEQQGVHSGDTLHVFRVISKLNPYDSRKRVNYKVHIGELTVLHSDKNAAIAVESTLFNGPKNPLLDIDTFMIGDHIAVKAQ